MTEITSQPMRPVSAAERIEVIDILRGFAILGILVVNMQFFANPTLAPRVTADTGMLDRAANVFINLFFTSKFYSLFSFLFGLGMSIQMSRAAERAARFVPLYLRRLFILLLFGLAHGILLWVGDILLLYAVSGVILLLLFRKAKPRALLIWAIILLVVLTAFEWLGVLTAELVPDEYTGMQTMMAERQEAARLDNLQDTAIYGSGNWFEVTAERARDFLAFLTESDIYIVPSVLAMFMIGLIFGKKRVFEDVEGNLRFFKRLLMWCLPIGLAGNLVFVLSGIDPITAGYTLNWTMGIGMTGLNIGAPTLSLAYIAGVTLLTRRATIQKLLAPLAPVGRMALTNYLLQSIICTTLFYGYGFALFGRVGLALGLLLSVVIYLLQIPFSGWWLKRFRFGPFEWLWRSLTYMKWQPFRRTQGQTARS